MKPIATKDNLPAKCIKDGSEEVWWWNAEDCSWTIGIAMLMDFGEPSTFEKYTHWLPTGQLPEPNMNTEETKHLVDIEDRAHYESENIRFYEWPQPICEIYDKNLGGYVHIKTIEDAQALKDSLERFIKSIEDD